MAVGTVKFKGEKMRKRLTLFEQREDRDTFFERVHQFVLPYHDGAILVAKAYQASKEAFRGVKRKRGERYFEHCRAVALIAMDMLGVRDPEVVAAALLHDVVEDIPGWNVGRIKKEFSPRIARLVSALTMPTRKFNSRERRMEAYHRQLCSGPKEALTIKFADRLHNLSTASSLSRSAQLRMIEETEVVYLPIAKERGILYKELKQAIASCKRALACRR
ncbi:MAG: hypothetical protein A3C93_02265 [Candidatus Lloydbacteria bacterium RIFCSPHIGHO2_02_FULL_54_17]|uniref:HD domain-containing protein n=1 Tax=Candidatus Lloydbacteria bacterium RIFCSPHIGHO2_02_FULL_54_17 TaxID=1798664 RepID=A0A1G2DDL7_9BACT|nr:MAG: hypothetical protein A2762_02145 [Candidatus Lloydbacteria bacterium RIFCSPHIGHO2_01_FULL_54_11]OGZ11737.1 MAG: hypothetical protein A3C93_02265 [Candidatus Lloydbacteria bacterium RIFCSPHIGHO2_02_FULL_54_17]OGZ14266.1 MAG: hypothetical protein A2948_01600 [Candidatus Lloydbacteria bacterium RIFCSPLOWO2_01_FULL_54_18]OGZ16610.1 MAG: hypothetical protein A3H76_04235 [Candidatus Lloydbacteria bacterium RIFCSPLOWO2_02_FULL_54_12]